MARQIFKSQGFDPNRFVPVTAPKVSVAPGGDIPQMTSMNENPAVEM